MNKSKRYAGILVKTEDKVLLCKRAEGDDKHDGEWSIPVGTVKKNEEPIDGAYREFYEETNIEITDEIELNALIGFVNKQELKGILYVYLYEVDREFDVNLEDAMDNHEHTDCGWFGLDELPEPMGIQLEKIVFRNLR
jgi:ADP-ribose pyrophosphatase YjhB (NUDIX family)